MSEQTRRNQESHISRIVKKIRLAIWNHLRFDTVFRFFTSAGLMTLMSIRRPLRRAETIHAAQLSARAARICPPGPILRRIEQTLLKHAALVDPRTPADWEAVCPDTASSEIAKGIILKAPVSPDEKGALLVAFESHFMRLIRHADLDALARDYHLIIAPTWSPPHDVPFLLAARKWPGRLFHLISSRDDIPAFRRIAPDCELIPLLSSNWVNPSIFSGDRPADKSYDIVMLANFAAYKRHFLLFRALRDMSPNTRVLLLGRRMGGRDADTIRAEAELYGVADRITIAPGLPDAEMITALRSAKVSLILSGNEGSCVAVVESMFADVPVGLFADAIVGSKQFVNERTGRLLSHHSLGPQLEEFIASADSYSPRAWVTENDISCYGSTRVLNDYLRRRTTAGGEQWTADIAVHQWRPNPTYVNDADVVANSPLYDDFESNYGCSLLLRSTDGVPIPRSVGA